MSYVALNDYIDGYGLVTKEGNDGGDSAHRHGFVYVGLRLLERKGVEVPEEFQRFGAGSYERGLDVLEVSGSRGNYRRHPDSPAWAAESDRMSRDQAIPLLQSMFLMGQYGRAWDFFNAHLGRGLLFMSNTRRNGATKENHGQEYAPGRFRDYGWKLPDLTLFEFWSIYIRGLVVSPFLVPLLFPLLCVLDLFLLLSAISKCVETRDGLKSDDLNLQSSMVYSALRCPTPVSWLAIRVYFRFRVMASQNDTVTEYEQDHGVRNGPESAVYRYFNPAHGEPPLYKLWIPVLRSLR